MITPKLQENLVESLKAHDSARVDTLRLLLSELKNAQINKRAELTEQEEITVLKKEVKKISESLEMFKKGGRNDLVEQHEAQLAILKEYVPAEMSDAELVAAVAQVMTDNEEAIQAQPRSLIGLALRELSPRADAKRIIAEVQKHLA